MSNNTISTTGSDAANQYRKKPVVIEAIHYTGAGNFADPRLPDWMWKALETGVAFNRKGELMLKTLEGEHLVSPGDWVVRGVKGELYPCKPDIFAATYEQASATDSDAVDLDRLEALALAYVYEDGDHWYSEGQFSDGITYEPAVNFMREATPAAILGLIAQARAAAPAVDPVVEANRQLLLDRSRVGLGKYGTTLADAGLSRQQLAQHALEEALDLANYLQTIIQTDNAASQPAPVLPQAAIPEGYKLVPLEPTAEMLVAGAESEDKDFGLIIHNCYCAMIAAAPVIAAPTAGEDKQ